MQYWQPAARLATWAISRLNGTPTFGQQAADDLAIGALNRAEGQFLQIFSGGVALLFWDSDGTGAADAQLITKMLTTTTLLGTDLFIF
jgi:hypothetical protein